MMATLGLRCSGPDCIDRCPAINPPSSLVELCVGLTRAAGAQGFLLQRDQIRLSPVTAQEIVAELQVRGRGWRIGGVSQSLMPLQVLRRSQGSKDSKRIYASVTGLTIYDLVHPVKY
jgi:hypothetical protein